MSTIVFTIIAALVIGFILGLLLGLFKKLFAVQVDPKVQAGRDLLSGGNCGGCGYAGCDVFARLVVEGKAPVNGCVAGGESCALAIAKVLGVEAGSSKKKIAFLRCNGAKGIAKEKAGYIGIKTCKAAVMTAGGIKACAYGCTGFGDCAASCPFDALHMGENGLPEVDEKKCTGCGKCTKTCPKNLFVLIDEDTKGSIARCSCHSENKAQIRKDCTAGCFKCGLCAKKCPELCIDISSGIPAIDYSKCTSCGQCVAACPDKVLFIRK